MSLFNNPRALDQTRRHFLASSGLSLGGMALASLAGGAAEGAPLPHPGANTDTGIGAALPKTHFPTKCKNVIYLHMVGGPAQMDLYDYKPKMQEYFDKDLPESVRDGPAAHHHDQRPGAVPDRAEQVQVQPHRASAGCG